MAILLSFEVKGNAYAYLMRSILLWKSAESLLQWSPSYGPRATSGLQSRFIQPAKTVCQQWKNNYIYKKQVDLVEWSLFRNTYITCDYDIRPSNLWLAYVALGQKRLEPLTYCVHYRSIPGSRVSLPTKRIVCDCCRNMGHFQSGVGKVKRFVEVHLHCNLKTISKMLTFPPWKISADSHDHQSIVAFGNELITFWFKNVCRVCKLDIWML